jgi:2-C-methyl-D-erythritol 4-phosphate cytidylyltransferase
LLRCPHPPEQPNPTLIGPRTSENSFPCRQLPRHCPHTYRTVLECSRVLHAINIAYSKQMLRRRSALLLALSQRMRHMEESGTNISRLSSANRLSSRIQSGLSKTPSRFATAKVLVMGLARPLISAKMITVALLKGRSRTGHDDHHGQHHHRR